MNHGKLYKSQRIVKWVCTVTDDWHDVIEEGETTGVCPLHGRVWNPKGGN